MYLLSLKWGCHSNILQNAIGKLYGKDDYADTTLFCDGKFFKAHKVVLTAYSDFFKNLFDQLVPSGKDPIVVLSNIKTNTLEFILKYIYLGEVVIPSDELESLVSASKLLKMKGLVSDEENIFNFDKLSIYQSQNAKETFDNDSLPFEEEYLFSKCDRAPQTEICDVNTNILHDSNKITIERVESLKHSGKKLDTNKDYTNSLIYSSAQELEQKQSEEGYILKGMDVHGMLECSKIQTEGSNLLALPQHLSLLARNDEVVPLNDDSHINKTNSLTDTINNSNSSFSSLAFMDNGYTINNFKPQYNGSPIGVINSVEFSEYKEDSRLLISCVTEAFEPKSEASSQILKTNEFENIAKYPVDVNAIKKNISNAKLRRLEVVLKRVKRPTLTPYPVRRSLRESISATSMKVRKQLDPSADEGNTMKIIKRIVGVSATAVKLRKQILQPKDPPVMKRRVRCGECKGCIAKNCMKCIYCRDRYSKINRLKQRCLYARCKKFQMKKNILMTKKKIVHHSAPAQDFYSIPSLRIDKEKDSTMTGGDAKIASVIDTEANSNIMETDASISAAEAKICSDSISVTANISLDAEISKIAPSHTAAVAKINSTIDSVLARYFSASDVKMTNEATSLEKAGISSKIDAEIPCYTLEADAAKASSTSFSIDVTNYSAINVNSGHWCRCYICSKIFPTGTKLQFHLRTHATPIPSLRIDKEKDSNMTGGEVKIASVIDTEANSNVMETDSSTSTAEAKICSDSISVTPNISLDAEISKISPSPMAAVTKFNSAINSVLAIYSSASDAKMTNEANSLENAVISLKTDTEIIPCYTLEADAAKASSTSSSRDVTNCSAINVDTVHWCRCYICSKIFPTKLKLQFHLRTHATPYACNLCKYKSTQNGALTLHIMTKHKHSTERPYFCFICSLSFKTCMGLTAHNKSKHA